MLKADLHIHTKYSMDSSTPLEKIIERCQELGINCIAIADHGTAEGALRMQEIAPFRVIVAEEVLTPGGEIMGMFLKETVPSGISVQDAISRIKAQGGLVCLPHPFDAFRESALANSPAPELISQIDIVEVFNARIMLGRYTDRARAFARDHGLPGSAGSDAHTVQEIGNAYVEIPEFDGAEDFLAALKQGTIHGHKTNPLIHFNSAWTKVKKKLNEGAS